MTETTRDTGNPLPDLTRRRFLQGSTLAGFGAFLAACTGGSSPSPAAGASASPDGGEITGPLNWANWPAYIDLNEDETASPTLEAFQEEYGIEVNYVEDIQGNEDFFATLQPSLSAGLDTGWDSIDSVFLFCPRISKFATGRETSIDPLTMWRKVSAMRRQWRPCSAILCLLYYPF